MFGVPIGHVPQPSKETLKELVEVLLQEGETEPQYIYNKKKIIKGVRRASFPKPFYRVRFWVVKYLTCDGQFGSMGK